MTPGRKKVLKTISVAAALFLVVLFGLAYTRYLDLKKIFLERISQKATALAGQQVTVGDFSLGLSGKIVLHDIVVSNPAGSKPGRLLAVKRLSLDLRVKELAGGEFSFRSVEIGSPEVTLLTGEKGIANVSEKLKRLLSEKGTTKYRIDQLRIHAGAVSLDDSIMTAGRDLDLHVKGLSSRKDEKTELSCSLSYAGNTVRIEGWAYMNTPERKFSLTVLSGAFGLSPLKETLGKYGVDARKLRADIAAGIEGDLEKGWKVSSRIQLKVGRSFAFYRDRNDIRLECEAWYDLPRNALTVSNLSLREGDASLLHLKGTVRDIGKALSYEAEVGIDAIDLSRFDLLQGGRISGEVTSGVMRVKGSSAEWLSGISGTARLRGGAVKSRDLEIGKADADLTFASDPELSVNGMISAQVISLQGYRPENPVGASITLHAKGMPLKMAVTAGLRLSPVGLKTADGGVFRLEALDSTVEGTLVRGGSFSGRIAAGMKGIVLGGRTVPSASVALSTDYRDSRIAIRDLKVASEDGSAAAGMIDLAPDRKRTVWSAAIRNVNALLPSQNVRAERVDVDLKIRKTGKGVSGELALIAGEFTFKGVPAKVAAATALFDENVFSVSIPAAEVAGGRASLKAKGRSTKGPFPVEAQLALEQADLGIISRGLGDRTIAYGAAGTLRRVVFNGTIDSPVSVHGNIAFETDGVSLLRRGDNKTVVKNVKLDGDAACSGEDCSFRANIVAGTFRAAASGAAKKFGREERVVNATVVVPETKLTDMRTSFWESVPDGLLYAGLDGAMSSDVSLEYSGGGMKASGQVRLTNMLFEGENGEYSAGPINGIVPIRYDSSKHAGDDKGIPSFEPSEFSKLSSYYSKEPVEAGYQKVSVGSFRYGFRILDGVNVWVKPDENGLNIGRLSANMFGGKLNGTARVDFSGGLAYRGGILLEGLSLARLCEEIEPIKGYISGRVDGVATIKGSGSGLANLIGKADFWAYSAGGEKTKISREFLQKVGGPSLKAYLGDRNFDKGVMGVYLQNGFVIFRELEISHKNMFGVADLSVKVAPFNNRIEISHLLWAVTEAAQRAKDKQ